MCTNARRLPGIGARLGAGGKPKLEKLRPPSVVELESPIWLLSVIRSAALGGVVEGKKVRRLPGTAGKVEAFPDD